MLKVSTLMLTLYRTHNMMAWSSLRPQKHWLRQLFIKTLNVNVVKTNLLTTHHQSANKAKSQSVMTLVFASAVVASVLVGYWQSVLGLAMVNILMLPAIFIAMATVYEYTKVSLSLI